MGLGLGWVGYLGASGRQTEMAVTVLQVRTKQYTNNIIYEIIQEGHDNSISIKERCHTELNCNRLLLSLE
jgi:hypothetical protein